MKTLKWKWQAFIRLGYVVTIKMVESPDITGVLHSVNQFGYCYINQELF